MGGIAGSIAFLIAGLVVALPAARPAEPTAIGVALHVSAELRDGVARPVEDPQAIEARLARANQLLAPAGVVLLGVSRDSLPPGELVVLGPEKDRNALAESVPRVRGSIEVFVVHSAANLDRKQGMLAGVHWRYGGKSAANRDRRYVILAAADSSPDTLAHELGHYFGLGHSRDPENLMAEAKIRTSTDLSAAQVDRIRRALATALRRGELRPAAALRP